MYRPVSTPPEFLPTPAPGGQGILWPSQSQQITNVILYSLVPIIGVCLLLITLFFLWRRRNHGGHSPLAPEPPTPTPANLPLTLLELRARGRYGSIWKAQMSGKYVAVKIFPLQDKGMITFVTVFLSYFH